MAFAKDKKVIIIGGGTISPIRTHMALCSPAYGTTAKRIYDKCSWMLNDHDIELHLTKMAGGSALETTDDVDKFLDKVIKDKKTHIVFLTAAICDYDANILVNNNKTISGKYEERLKTQDGDQLALLSPSEKVIEKIRKERKDIFLIGFKTTTGATPEEQFNAGFSLCKAASCNLVLANDTKTRFNIIITPEGGTYGNSDNREDVLKELVIITKERSSLNFVRTTIKEGDLVHWENMPESFRTVMDYCIEKHAYKPFKDKTVGHFAVKNADGTMFSSRRKINFNENRDMVIVEFKDKEVIAHGAKPSAGARSQYQLFQDHPEYDCIVHFHCPIKPDSKVPVASQREFECGSIQCGLNTSDNLGQFGNIGAVYLDKHGPNIMFNKNIDPNEVISFIEQNFDLGKQVHTV